MAKKKKEKQKIVKDLEDKLSRMKSLVFVNFAKLSVKETQELRKILKQEKIDYLVAKKTLLKIALKKTPLKDLEVDKLAGSLALALGYEDELLPAKLLYNFSQAHEALKLIGGVMENKFVAAEDILELAKLPSKQELIQKVVWLVGSPLSGLVNVLAGNLRQLILVLKAMGEKR